MEVGAGRSEKRFNKAMNDLMIVSHTELACNIASTEGDYAGWIRNLKNWRNRLSPDLSKDELEELDLQLNNAKVLLNSAEQSQDIEDICDNVEQKLYGFNVKSGISNPVKIDMRRVREEWEEEDEPSDVN